VVVAPGQTAGVIGASTNNVGVLGLSNNAAGIMAQGNPSGYFVGDVQVTGDLILLNSPQSGDTAEDFDVESEPVHSEPGTVLVINSRGRLSASDLQYDTRVAGVVSGAGDLRPAVVLQRFDKPGRFCRTCEWSPVSRRFPR
jgi:hypothetical protein